MSLLFVNTYRALLDLMAVRLDFLHSVGPQANLVLPILEGSYPAQAMSSLQLHLLYHSSPPVQLLTGPGRLRGLGLENVAPLQLLTAFITTSMSTSMPSFQRSYYWGISETAALLVLHCKQCVFSSLVALLMLSFQRFSQYKCIIFVVALLCYHCP